MPMKESLSPTSYLPRLQGIATLWMNAVSGDKMRQKAVEQIANKMRELFAASTVTAVRKLPKGVKGIKLITDVKKY